MKKIISTVAVLVLAACSGQQNTSATKDSADAVAATSGDVKVRGPYELAFDEHTLIQNQGKAFTVEIDKHTVRACKKGWEYKSAKIGSNEYVVQIRPLMVTMEACTPEMFHDIEYGTTIEIPAAGSFTYAKIHVQRTTETGATTVEVKTVEGVTVTRRANIETFAEYNMSQMQGKAFSIEIDYEMIRACYKSIGHFASVIGRGEHFVKIEPLMIPAVVCTPGMERDIQTGVKIDVPAAEGLSLARILVKKAFGLPRVKAAVTAQD